VRPLNGYVFIINWGGKLNLDSETPPFLMRAQGIPIMSRSALGHPTPALVPCLKTQILVLFSFVASKQL
jgi:hypothetical protein